MQTINISVTQIWGVGLPPAAVKRAIQQHLEYLPGQENLKGCLVTGDTIRAVAGGGRIVFAKA